MEAPQRAGLSPLELVGAALPEEGTVAVTGASGWFGATALDLLHSSLGKDAPGRVVGYARSGREIALPSGRRVRVRPLDTLLSDAPPAVLLHFAYLTRDKAADLGVADYVAGNVAISALVVQAVRRHRPKLVVTASSGAVYERDGALAYDLVRNPYGALKVIDELAFAQAAQEVGAGWAVPRVFAVAGPGITKPEKYAIGSMIAMARRGGPIEVQAARPTYRSYCGVDEVVALSLWSAGRSAGIFDTHGLEVEMADLANTVSRVVGHDCPVIRERLDPRLDADRYVGEPSRFAELVAQSGLRLASLDELVSATAQAMPDTDSTRT